MFKSKSQRFAEKVKTNPAPGPGTYHIKSYINPGKEMRRSKSQPAKMDYLNLIGNKNVLRAPSIPTREQCFGYEEDETGHLQLQQPLQAGYKGTKNDSVGPGDYDIKLSGKFNKKYAVTFHKVTRCADIP